jgi:hypothetical protein
MALHLPAFQKKMFLMADPSIDYSFLSWNVRGLNNPTKQEDVKQIIQVHKPLIVYLQETKLARVLDSLWVSICNVRLYFLLFLS